MAGAGFDVYVLEEGIITPGGIDTIDGSDLLGNEPAEASTDPLALLGVAPSSIMGEYLTESSRGATGSNASAEPSMANGLRDTIDALQGEQQSPGEELDTVRSELEATQKALKADRHRVRELVQELKKMRQAFTALQRKAHAALERERAAYEKELAQSVRNLEEGLREKDRELQAQRVAFTEELARVRGQAQDNNLT